MKPRDLDHGIGCIVRADPTKVKESWITCDVIEELNGSFRYAENEELVSNIIRLRPTTKDDQLAVSIGAYPYRFL